MDKNTPEPTFTPENEKEFRQSVKDAIVQNQAAMREAEEYYYERYLGVGFMFIAVLKTNEPRLADYDAQCAFDIVTPHLQGITGQKDIQEAWYDAVGRTNNNGDNEDPIQFWFTYWHEVKAYQDPLRMALRDILEYPDLYALNLPRYREGYIRFVQLCEALARRIHSQRIFIAKTRWAKDLDVSPTMVTQYRKYAIDTGLLKMVVAHDPRKRLAPTYEIDTEVLATLKGKTGPQELK